jgi:hypothetical protein
MEIEEEFTQIHPNDLWVYNKLQLSTKLGYNCGPAGMKVPSPGLYIVRPSVNFMGMGRNSRIITLESSTEHLHPGEFWCEVFQGEHLSVDYHHQKPILTVKGHRNPKNSLSRWNCWSKITKNIPFPDILNNLTGNYEWINCEFIDKKLIEVHFRQNPDFQYNNSVAIPVWEDETLKKYQNMTYIESKDDERLGFWVK